MIGHRVVIKAVVGMAEACCECGWSECVEHPEPMTIEEIDRMIVQHRIDATKRKLIMNKED